MRWSISALKFMYNMERFATQIYLTQRRSFPEEDIVNKLTAAADNEQQHVDILKKRILELNGNQSHIGFLFQTAGRILALVAGLFGRILVLKTDALVERRAISDYGGFLNRVNFDDKTVAMIKRIIADEERHVEMWQGLTKQLKTRDR